MHRQLQSAAQLGVADEQERGQSLAVHLVGAE
jgi:hypothetical protein